jgi:hypothetical protein
MKSLIIRYGEFWRRTDLFDVTENGRLKSLRHRRK